MPTTCREQILAALQQRLESITGITGLAVEREREEPVEGEGEDGAPASDAVTPPLLVIYDLGVVPRPDFAGEMGYTLNASIEGVRAGASVLDARRLADELEGKVADAIFADITLGGIASDIRLNAEPQAPRLPWTMMADVGSFQCSIEIDYATKETDSSTFA